MLGRMRSMKVRWDRWLRRMAALALLAPALASAQQVPLQYYGQQDGLANLAVSAMARDHDGYLWVGTENGLFRFNGASVQREGQDAGVDQAPVTALLVDRDNRLWVGNYNALFLKVGDGWQRVLREDGRNVDIWPGQSLIDSPDGTYLVTGSRVYTLTLRDGRPRVQPVFSEVQVGQHAALAAIHSVHVDAGAALWMGCGNSLCHSGRAGLRVWGSAQGVPADEWHAILRDRGGQLWARGNHHLIALPPGAQRFIDRTPPGLLRKSNLHPWLAMDEQGLVLSNVDDGLVRWDRARWEHYGRANGLRAAGGLNAAQFDRDGGLWLGSRGLGLIHWLGYGNWENWSAAQGLPDDVVLSFVRDAAGVLYAGTRSGIARFVPETGRFSTMARGRHTDQWSSLVLDREGQAWAGSYAGALARLGGDGQIHLEARKLPMVHQLLIDPDQRLWLATDDGIAVRDIAGRAQTVRPPDGLQQPVDANSVGFFAQCRTSDGALWFLGSDHLLRLEDGNWSSFAPRALGMGSDLYGMSCSASGALWLGDLHGRLWRVTRAGLGLQAKTVENRLLRGAAIVAIHEDRRGWLWVGADAGIAVWNGEHWRSFNQNDGLVWNDTNGRGFYEDVDGSMWIATSNGASHVRRPELLFAPQTLSVRIEAAHRATQPLASGPAWILPWSTTPLELNLASLDAQNRAMLRFHYRLAGLEESWNESAVPQLRYAALPPGDYRFDYYASNAYSHRASPLQSQIVTILPPWWRTTWFYLLCAVLALVLLALLYRLRIRHLLLRQLHTERLVSARTRDLEQSREALRQRALRDSLTGAWNRGAILDLIERALEQASAAQQPVLLVLLDLDHFKRINDRYGHAAGDAVLRETVARLNAVVRQSDAVGRYGGEEFLVLLPGLNTASGKARVEQLRNAIRCEPIRISEDESITVTGSFGAIGYEVGCPLELAELIERADQALYRSKNTGRDRIEYALTG